MTGYSLVLYRLILKLEIFVTNKYCSPKIFIFTKKNTILDAGFYSIYRFIIDIQLNIHAVTLHKKRRNPYTFFL